MLRKVVLRNVFLAAALVAMLGGHGCEANAFTDVLRHILDDVLGVKQFQDYVDALKKIAPATAIPAAPAGGELVKKIADDIQSSFTNHVAALKSLVTAINLDLTSPSGSAAVTPVCCNLPAAALDLRFKNAVNTSQSCLYTAGTSDQYKVSDRTVTAMKTNLDNLPKIKFQYFGGRDGTGFVYPAANLCTPSTFDPRFRPWFYETVSGNAKDVVIFVDISSSMGDPHSAGLTKLAVAVNATATILDTLTSNDRVAVVAFGASAKYPMDDPCLKTSLMPASPPNERMLKDFLAKLVTVPGEANYSLAFEAGFEILNASRSDRIKVALLVTDGVDYSTFPPADYCRIKMGNAALNNSVVFTTLGVSSNINDAQRQFLQTIAAQNSTEPCSASQGTQAKAGVFETITTAGADSTRAVIRSFFDMLKNPKADVVTFSVPYLDAFGNGLVTSACLPVMSTGQLFGVACVDISLDLVFNEVINFRVGQLSYGFIVDGQGRAIVHHLLPQPTAYDVEPVLVHIKALETSDAIDQIVTSMLKGETQSISTKGKFVLNRGVSPLQGSEQYEKSATYYWTRVAAWNLTACLVIIEGEVDNFKFSNNTANTYPSAFFTRDLDVSNRTQPGLCNMWTIASSVERSTVKLAPMSFVDPFNYTILNYSIVGSEVPSINQIRQYLEGKTEDGGPLSVRPGIREVVAMTYKLEEIWKATADKDFWGYTLSRYIGTPEGVFRRYPGTTLSPEYDNTRRPWYSAAVADGQKGKITVTIPYPDPTGQIKLTILTTIVEGSATGVHVDSDPIVGVMGLDITLGSFYNFIKTKFDPCTSSSAKCIVIDKSGYIVVHPDYAQSVSAIPAVAEHITSKEPALSAELVQSAVMSNETCVNFVDVTLQAFWEVYGTANVTLPSGSQVYPVDGSNLYIIVQSSGGASSSGQCSCLKPTGNGPCETGKTCQCPCYSTITNNYCTGLPITNMTRPCVPSIELLHVTDVIPPSRDAAAGLADCRPCDVTGLFTTEASCSATYKCCWRPGNSNSSCQQCSPAELTTRRPPELSSGSVSVRMSLSVVILQTVSVALIAIFINRGRN